MVSLRVFVDSKQAGATLTRNTQRQGDRVRTAARQAAQDLADSILSQGRVDIAKAGKFGARWIFGLQARVGEGGGNIRVSITHDNPFFRVFQRGALIKGKPLLWIPLSFASGVQGIFARNYPGRLVRVDSKAGDPLLLDTATGQPKYVGLTEVTVPKKFHILEIARQTAAQTTALYRTRWRALG